MNIIHLRHNEIDFCRWDDTVASSLCGLPYAYSWWLDVVDPLWEALVSDDYEFVMPLPLKEKMGVKYLIHPVWTQQLGIYSQHEVTKDVFCLFKKNIPYLVYDFNINYTNCFKGNKIEKRVNLILDCDKDIADLRSNYSSNTKRNIKRARKSGLNIREIDAETMVDMWMNDNVASSPLHISTIRSLIDESVRHSNNNMSDNRSVSGPYNGLFKSHIYGVYEGDDVVAALFGVETRDRFIYLIPVSSRRGKELSAMFMLFDEIVENICCKKGLKFDCEGSMVPGVSRFYRGFGAVEESYGVIRRCHPAWLVRLLHI